MPSRVVTDSITNWFLHERNGQRQLRRAGVTDDRIFLWATVVIHCSRTCHGGASACWRSLKLSLPYFVDSASSCER